MNPKDPSSIESFFYDGIDPVAAVALSQMIGEWLPPPVRSKRWTHDCDKCIWLGTLLLFDFYRCDKQPTGRTYIARRSSEPSDYSSMPTIAMKQLEVDGFRLQSKEKWMDIIFQEHLIDSAPDYARSETFRFALMPTSEIVISELVGARRKRFIEDAAKFASPEFKYRKRLPQTFAEMRRRIEQLVDYQIKIKR